MPQAEQNMRRIRREFDKIRFANRNAVRQTVSIRANGSIWFVHDCNMNEFACRRFDLFCLKGLSTRKAIATSHPLIGTHFAVHDGIKDTSRARFNADCGPAALRCVG